MEARCRWIALAGGVVFSARAAVALAGEAPKHQALLAEAGADCQEAFGANAKGKGKFSAPMLAVHQFKNAPQDEWSKWLVWADYPWDREFWADLGPHPDEITDDATVRSILCVRTVSRVTGRYTDGSPAHTVDLEAIVMSWPDKRPLGAKKVSAAPPQATDQFISHGDPQPALKKWLKSIRD